MSKKIKKESKEDSKTSKKNKEKYVIHRETKPLKETIENIRRPLIDYINLLEDPVKYRFLRRKYKLDDNDLFTRKEFEKMKKEMYGG